MARKKKSEAIRFASTVRRDVKAAVPGPVTVLRSWVYYQRNLGLRAVLRYRVANFLYRRGLRNVAWYLSARTTSLTGADIAPDARIGGGLKLPHPNGVVIGHGCDIGKNCTILQGVTLGERYTSDGHKYPKIGNRVVIGAGAKLLGGIEIGSSVKVGANSVVLTDVPHGATIVGVPGRIAYRNPRQSISEELTA